MQYEEVVEVSVDHIAQFVDYRCTEIEAASLLTLISGVEIKQVLFSMSVDKAPGPDDYTLEFYKKA